ncbi:MAG: hypothetical protein KJ000_05250 [Pirellulaceae bacterium]|nr:hypothetical protein [Pirellulaceae bacterium]
MKLDEMPIVEPTSPVRFRNRERLMEHVVKHVLENRDERWQQLLDEDWLAKARVEYRNGRTGKAVNRIARQYQTLVGDCLVSVCEQGRSHQHSCRYTLDFADRSRRAISQIIDAWPDQEKFVIAASAFVKNDQLTTYRLQTAFRPWPRLSAKGHRRKARERARTLKMVHPRCLLQIHDPQDT